MKSLYLSFEDNEPDKPEGTDPAVKPEEGATPPPPPTAEEDPVNTDTPVEVTAATAEVDLSADQIGDAKEAIETVQKFIGIIEQKQETGGANEAEPDPAVPAQAVSETAATIATESMKYFSRRLGDKNPFPYPSMESFGTPSGAVASTRSIKNAMEHFCDRTNAVIVPSNEGLMDSIKNAWHLLWISQENLSKRLDAAVDTYHRSEHSGNEIMNPVWGKYVNYEGKTQLDARDLINAVAGFQDMLSNKELAAKLKEVAKTVDGLTSDISRRVFSLQKSSIESIEVRRLEITVVYKEILEGLAKGESADKKITLEALQQHDLSDLVGVCNQALERKVLEDGQEDLMYALEAFQEVYNRTHAEAGVMHSVVLNLAYSGYHDASRLLREASRIIESNLKAVHGCVGYILASCDKKD